MEWKKQVEINFIKTDITNIINEFRVKLYKRFHAPIDAMWEQLYIGYSQHYLIEIEKVLVGYCCVDSSGSLLQIFLEEEINAQMDKIIALLIELKLIIAASLSSIEPISFNACLFLSNSVKTNTFCFQHPNNIKEHESSLKIESVSTEDIPAVKLFLLEQIGMDDTFGYTENLVVRKEIFVIKEANVIIATSECRMSDSQTEVADLGVIVNRDFQGRGIGTKILQTQVNSVLAAKRKPICSTTLDNIASQKAIEKSGFYCSNIIFDMSF